MEPRRTRVAGKAAGAPTQTKEVGNETNILVYSRVVDKQKRAHEWLDFLWETRRGRLSRQVLQEYYATVTRKLEARALARRGEG